MKKLLSLLVFLIGLSSCSDNTTTDDEIDMLINNIQEEFIQERNTEEEIIVAEETIDIGGENWICTTKEISISKTPSFFPLFDPGSDTLYPGSALQGNSIQSFPPNKIPVKRNGGSVVINNYTGTSTSSIIMDEVSLVNVTNAANEIISAQSNSFPTRTFISINQIKTTNELALNLSANASFFSIFLPVRSPSVSILITREYYKIN